jgi:glycosyltransferase involved in cell wall biosynthesis
MSREPGSSRAADPVDILILGPAPPPFGGVSMHLHRLVPVLDEAGLSVGVLNHFPSTEMPYVVGTLKRNPLRYYRLARKVPARVVHYHHSRWLQLLAVAASRQRRSARYVLTLHAGDMRDHFPQFISRLAPVRRMTEWALRKFDTIIVVNPTIAEAIRARLPALRVELLPAFLESPGAEEAGYDPELESFLDSGRVLVVAAYAVDFLRGDREIYGLDLAVDAFVRLTPKCDDLRLALFVARRPTRAKARRYLERLEQRLHEAGLQGRFVLAFGRTLLPALRGDAIFVRPTRADGDALSVREALAAGLPVVASDIVDRPSGVVLFAAGDAAALSAALEPLLDGARSPASSEPESAGSAAGSFSEHLVSLYREQLAVQDDVGRGPLAAV